MAVIAVDEYSPAAPKSTNSTRFVKGNLQVRRRGGWGANLATKQPPLLRLSHASTRLA